jgi:hypothetical protein
MACGTHVLPVSLGTISEIIKDEETRFFLRDNLLGCIAEDIVDTLSDLKSEKIAIIT